MPWPQDPDLRPPDPRDQRMARIQRIVAISLFLLLMAGLAIKNWLPASAVVG